MTSHLFEETDIHYGYSAIHRFFGVAHAVAAIESAILAAAGNTAHSDRG